MHWMIFELSFRDVSQLADVPIYLVAGNFHIRVPTNNPPSMATRRRLATLCLDYLAGWPEQYGDEAAVARILCGNVNLQVDDDILNNAVSQRVASVSRKRPHRCLQALASRGSVRWLASENNVGEGERWGS